jgi:branched-chain amino acid transport system ATP-binding protein
MSALLANGLSINRAGLPVVREATLSVDTGSISVLLGVNGAGKTTLLEGISGVIPLRAGEVRLDGRRIEGVRPSQRARLGLAHVQQGRAVFRELTTEENLRVALHPSAAIGEAFALFPELEQRRNIRAGLLSGGEQQMLVIARALLSRPKVLLIDEMSLGLAPVIVRRLMAAVRELANRGLAVLLVEQFASLALAIGDRAFVLRRGRIVYDGDCASLRASPEKLHNLYLGDRGDAATAPLSTGVVR